MRFRATARFVLPAGRESGRKIRPLTGRRVGLRIQSRLSRPASGKADLNSRPCSATRRRDVEVSRMTRNRATPRQVQPRSRAICGARRDFRSTPITVPPASGTDAFTSFTATTLMTGCQAKTSIDPRSPKIEKDTSTATSQRATWYSSTSWSTTVACSSSMSRARPSPRQRKSSDDCPPTADAARQIVVRDTADLAQFDPTDNAASEAAPSRESTWRHPRRWRSPTDGTADSRIDPPPHLGFPRSPGRYPTISPASGGGRRPPAERSLPRVIDSWPGRVAGSVP